MPFTDLTLAADCRPTCPLSAAEYLLHVEGGHPVSLSHYLHRYSTPGDTMHVLDHHGLAAIICGSIVNILVHTEGRLGTTIAARLEKVNAEASDYFSTHLVSCVMPPLRESNLQVTEWGELCGPLVKAANTRHYCTFAEELACRYFDGADRLHLAIRRCIGGLNGVYHGLYGGKLFFEDEELIFLDEQLHLVGKYHQVCRQLCKDRNSFNFQIKQKAHYAQHLGMWARLINPRAVQNYVEEGFMGKVQKMWRASCQGPYAKTVQKTVLMKYLVLLIIEFEL